MGKLGGDVPELDYRRGSRHGRAPRRDQAPYLDVRVHQVLGLPAEHPLLGGDLPLLGHCPGGADPFAVVPDQQHPVHLAGRPGPDTRKVWHWRGDKKESVKSGISKADAGPEGHIILNHGSEMVFMGDTHVAQTPW